MLGNRRAQMWAGFAALLLLSLVAYGCGGDTQAKKLAHFQKVGMV